MNQNRALLELRMHLLLVEDDASLSDGIARSLLGAGHVVEARASGVEALEAARQERFDLVLLDIGLPGIDGYEVAVRMRKMDATREALLIALTGYGQASDRAKAEQAGFDAHLVKPVDPAELERLLAAPSAR